MSAYENDRLILRELASKFAEIAALPVQQETKRLWKAINRLKPERPMFMMDQLPWHELNGDGELTLRCQDDFCRQMEWNLRAALYKWNHMRDDSVIEPCIDIAKVIKGAHFGIEASETGRRGHGRGLRVLPQT